MTLIFFRHRFINHKNMPALQAFFPNMQLEELDTGHWGEFYDLNPILLDYSYFLVHAEKPTEFRKLVVDFLKTT